MYIFQEKKNCNSANCLRQAQWHFATPLHFLHLIVVWEKPTKDINTFLTLGKIDVKHHLHF